jgi:hypothetical protein
MEMLRRALTPYIVLRNRVDYPLRRWIRPRFPVRSIEAVGLDVAVAELAPGEQTRARALIDEYGLRELAARGRRRDVLENLYYLELLTTGLERVEARLPDTIEALDAGCSDWFYAPALIASLKHWRTETPRTVQAWGLEADPGRRYADGHSREDWAAWYAEGLAEAHYVPHDVRTFQGEVDFATMLFPFIFNRDGDDWGLPRSLFRPDELLTHVWARVRPGGVLLIANQGEDEAAEQRRLCTSVGIDLTWSGRFESPFWHYPLERYVHVARRA